MNNVITYQQMTEQPIGPNNPVEESGGCAAGGPILIIFLIVIVGIIIGVIKHG